MKEFLFEKLFTVGAGTKIQIKYINIIYKSLVAYISNDNY